MARIDSGLFWSRSMPKKREPLNVTAEERATLERWARRPKTAQALAMRCRIVLLDDAGESYEQIADRVGVRVQTVLKWRKRFLVRRLDGLMDEPRPGVARTITDAQVEMVVART